DADRRDLLAFPTRRSSDLTLTPALDTVIGDAESGLNGFTNALLGDLVSDLLGVVNSLPLVAANGTAVNIDLTSLKTSVINELLRSEEHTSELQSRETLVCR